MDSQEDIVRKFWLERAKRPDFLWRDLVAANFQIIEPFLRKELHVLDLGAGDGRLSALVADRVDHLHAVDYTGAVERLRFHPKCSVSVADIRTYEDTGKYDLVLLFGVMNFIPNTTALYRRCKELLADGGLLIVKHQCGRRGHVHISTKIDRVPYESDYPFMGTDVADLLEAGFKKVEVSHPYPPSMNTWTDTIYTAFVASL